MRFHNRGRDLAWVTLYIMTFTVRSSGILGSTARPTNRLGSSSRRAMNLSGRATICASCCTATAGCTVARVEVGKDGRIVVIVIGKEQSPEKAAGANGEAREGGPRYEERIIRRGDQSPGAMREKAYFVLGAMEQRMAALGFGWTDVTATQVYTIFDIHPLLADEFVRRGAIPGGLTWHFARPPVRPRFRGRCARRRPRIGDMTGTRDVKIATPLKDAGSNFDPPPSGAALAGRKDTQPYGACLKGVFSKRDHEFEIHLPPAKSPAISRSPSQMKQERITGRQCGPLPWPAPAGDRHCDHLFRCDCRFHGPVLARARGSAHHTTGSLPRQAALASSNIRRCNAKS